MHMHIRYMQFICRLSENQNFNQSDDFGGIKLESFINIPHQIIVNLRMRIAIRIASEKLVDDVCDECAVRIAQFERNAVRTGILANAINALVDQSPVVRAIRFVHTCIICPLCCVVKGGFQDLLDASKSTSCYIREDVFSLISNLVYTTVHLRARVSTS